MYFLYLDLFVLSLGTCLPVALVLNLCRTTNFNIVYFFRYSIYMSCAVKSLNIFVPCNRHNCLARTINILYARTINILYARVLVLIARY